VNSEIEPARSSVRGTRLDVGIAAGAVFGGLCTAGTATMATAAGMPYLIPLATAGCGIAADTVSNVTAGAMQDSLS
jgi:hypothetical protein